MEATITRPSSMKARKIAPSEGWANRSWHTIWKAPETPFNKRFDKLNRKYTRAERAFIHFLDDRGWTRKQIADLCGIARESVDKQLGYPDPLPKGVTFEGWS